MTLTRLLTLGLLITSLAACTPWTRVDPGSRNESKRDDYTIDLPLGWVKRTADSNDLFVTRDGPALNYIVVNRQPHDRKLPRTKRETRADMLPHELAELAIAEWKGYEATANLQVLSNTATLLDGQPAARIHIRYKNDRGLPPSSGSWSGWWMPRVGSPSSMKRLPSCISSAIWPILMPWLPASASLDPARRPANSLPTFHRRKKGGFT